MRDFSMRFNLPSWKEKIRNCLAMWLFNDELSSTIRPKPPVFDTTQMGIECEGLLTSEMYKRLNSLTFKKDDEIATVTVYSDKVTSAIEARRELGWNLVSEEIIRNKQLPMISGRTRVYQSFKPKKMTVTELVCSTYGGDGLPDITLYEYLEHADDAVLVQAFTGNYNCFPNAPDQSSGIAASSLHNADISWPTINPGIDVNVSFMIEPSILMRAKANLPSGYDPIPKYIDVKIRANIFGPQLR